MKKRISFFSFFALCCCTILLTGCINTTLKSMGTQPIPIVHQPRMNLDKSKPEIALSAEGFSILNSEWANTEKIYGGGGIFNGTIYGANFLSPLFLNLAVGGYGGNVNFTCDTKKNCSQEYLDWLQTKQGKSDYSFWAFQEQVALGAEFNVKFLIFGLKAGVHTFQGGGDYDDKREQLEKISQINNNDNFGVSYTQSLWIGSRLGSDGKYGNLVFEISSSLDAYYDDNLHASLSASYFHPSGFHGGIMFVQTPGIELFAGKTFYF